jgi:hypothetical protein
MTPALQQILHEITVRLTKLETQRTWAGLTDEEIKTICVENGWDSSWQSMRFARAIEAKLKEKNGA